MDNLAKKFAHSGNLENEPITHVSNMSYTSGILPTPPGPLHIGIISTSQLVVDISLTLTLPLFIHLAQHNTQGIQHIKINKLTMIHTEIITLMIPLRKLNWMLLSLMVGLIQLSF